MITLYLNNTLTDHVCFRFFVDEHFIACTIHVPYAHACKKVLVLMNKIHKTKWLHILTMQCIFVSFVKVKLLPFPLNFKPLNQIQTRGKVGHVLNLLLILPYLQQFCGRTAGWSCQADPLHSLIASPLHAQLLRHAAPGQPTPAWNAAILAVLSGPASILPPAVARLHPHQMWERLQTWVSGHASLHQYNGKENTWNLRKKW